MKIRKVTIANYKSIKNPVEIFFSESLPTVLIGKNGSGKSNILEALSIIAEANSNYWGFRGEESFEYQIHLELSEKDISRLFPGKSIDVKKCSFIAYSSENMKIDRIKSEYLVPLLNSELLEIRDKAKELRKLLHSYNKQLGYISNIKDDGTSFYCFQVDMNQKTVTNFATLSWKIERPIEDTERIINSLLKNFYSNQTVLSFTPIEDYFRIDDDFSFELQYEKPHLAPFEEKYITINEEALKNEIYEINKKTRKLSDRITALLIEIDEHICRLKAALSNDLKSIEAEDVSFYHFLREIRKCIGFNCYFLRNENNEMIFKNKEKEQIYYHLNDRNSLIFKTYLLKVYNGDDKNDLLQRLLNLKDISLSDIDFSEFESYLNKNLPKFEDGMYEKISVEKQNNNVEIILHERNGDMVNLNCTSLGRRWYFTYYFTKNVLKSGDFFIIDEPAAALHPIAQKEVMKELFDIKNQGINVVYSTHSRDLIPDEWECVHFVAMGKNGTDVSHIKAQKDYFDWLKSLTGNDPFDLQDIAEQFKYGNQEEIAHKCYKRAVDCFGCEKKAAEMLDLSVDTLKSWKKRSTDKKFRSPKLDNILLVAHKTSTNIFDLL